MEEGEATNRAAQGQSGPVRHTKDRDTQADCRLQGHGPRLSKTNLFTLLSLWMELFPQEEHEDDGQSQIRGIGLVVVRGSSVVGLHCSGAELHAGQAAIIQHGTRLADCELYFSRRPCATCLKMIINVGVRQISFWPGDPEVSMLKPAPKHQPNAGAASAPASITEEATLDAIATEKLKSNSRPHICVTLQPMGPGQAQFVNESSRECDFMERIANDEPGTNTEELFSRERIRHLTAFTRRFLVPDSQQHWDILTHMHLENFCVEPYFSSLRHNMRELVEVLAAVAAGVPQQNHGFYRESSPRDAPLAKSSLPPRDRGLTQDVARHCIIQARLLAHRTEDHKVGVGAVIWARGRSAGCDGTDGLYLVGCGYNAYPTGSQYAEYPQMDNKQEDRQRRKYRYIVHAEQNALTFRARDLKPEEPTMLFVTKCPCDECIPLIRGAGISHIYTTDQDRGKDKGDISYLRFSSLKDISKFIWQRSPSVCAAPAPRIANGYVGKHSRQTELESHSNKKLRINTSSDSPTMS